MKNRKLFHLRFYSVCLIVFLALFGFWGGVSSSAAQAGENQKGQESSITKQNADILTGNFAHGAKLWAGRCGSCHNLRDPKDLSDVQWKVVVTHMRLRAGLTGQDARDILTFLQKSN